MKNVTIDLKQWEVYTFSICLIVRNSDGQTTSKPKSLRKRAESIQFVCIASPDFVSFFLSGSPGTIHLPFSKGKMDDHRSQELDKLREAHW